MRDKLQKYYFSQNINLSIQTFNCGGDVIVIVNAGGQVDLSFMDEFENIKALLVIVQQVFLCRVLQVRHTDVQLRKDLQALFWLTDRRDFVL